MRRLLLMFRDTSASAGAEMALVTPLLMILMFGSFELGNYFHQEHLVSVAVRDGARFAARHSFTDFTDCAVASDVAADTQQVTMTGKVSGGTARIGGWTDPTTVDVTAMCGFSAEPYWEKGIYSGNSDGSVAVRVEATVDYKSVFGNLGFGLLTTKLYARSDAAVIGT